MNIEEKAILLSLLIALFGGIPGLIAIAHSIKRGSKLHIRPEFLCSGDIPQISQSYKLLIIGTNISNSGEIPLTIGLVNLKYKKGRKYIPLKRASFTNDIKNLQFSGNSESKGFEITDFSGKDLHKSIPLLAQGRNVSGFLTYLMGKNDADCIVGQSPRLRFECTDSSGKKYKIDYHSKNRNLFHNEAFPRFAFKPIHSEPDDSGQPM